MRRVQARPAAVATTAVSERTQAPRLSGYERDVSYQVSGGRPASRPRTQAGRTALREAYVYRVSCEELILVVAGQGATVSEICHGSGSGLRA